MIKAIVTDIEGTTSSLSFVKDVLFPYARAKLPEYVTQHKENPAIQELLAETCRAAGMACTCDIDPNAAITQLVEWIDQDKKITPLKALQGLIWQAGYEQGDFKGHLYPDAIANLKAWKAKGISLYVYSSGSVLAQKLLFGHTEVGDLSPLFSRFFDTNIGGKKDADSYRNIAEEIGLPVQEIMFLSDIKEELDAAKVVGYQTIWLTREQEPVALAEHRQVSSFDGIKLDS
jgi:enolase-phosphatase E1